MTSFSAPVAQLDRALPSEGRGREFESRRARQQHQLFSPRKRSNSDTRCPQNVRVIRSGHVLRARNRVMFTLHSSHRNWNLLRCVERNAADPVGPSGTRTFQLPNQNNAVRFAPKADKQAGASLSPLSAKTRHSLNGSRISQGLDFDSASPCATVRPSYQRLASLLDVLA
jgi:hypothetical protein